MKRRVFCMLLAGLMLLSACAAQPAAPQEDEPPVPAAEPVQPEPVLEQPAQPEQPKPAPEPAVSFDPVTGLDTLGEEEFLLYGPERAQMTGRDGAPDAVILQFLTDCEVGLADDAFTFGSLADQPEQISSENLYLLFLLWTKYAVLELYQHADDEMFYFPEALIRRTLDRYLEGYQFDITQCREYDADTGMIVTPMASGFGGGRNIQLVGKEHDGSTIVYYTEFYSMEYDGTTDEEPYARKAYQLSFYDGGFTVDGAYFVEPEIRELPQYGLRLEIPPQDEAGFVFGINETNIIALFDTYTHNYINGGGYVWWLRRYSYEAFEAEFGRSAEEWSLSVPGPELTMFGRTKDEVYVLALPSDVQFDTDDPESSASYARSCRDSGRILRRFFELNEQIEPNPLLHGESLSGVITIFPE